MMIPAKETKHLHTLRGIAILLSVLLMAAQALTQLLPYRDIDAAGGGQLACTANGTYFAVAPDGRLVTWGSNLLTPHISFDSEFLSTPFFARRTMMTNVQKVCASGREVLALDGDGTLWLWDDVHPNGGYPSVIFPFTGAPKKVMEHVADFDKAKLFGNDAAIVTQDGELWIMDHNNVLQPGLGEANAGKKEPAPIMEDAQRVFLLGKTGFAVKGDGSLWAWHSDAGFRGFPYTPVCIAEDIAEVSETGDGSAFFVLTEDGEVYTYDMDRAREAREYRPEFMSDAPVASGVEHLYSGAWLKGDGALERVTYKDGVTGVRPAAENVMYAASDAYNGQRRTQMTITPDGLLGWDGGSVSLGGLSPKWRDAALVLLLAAALLRWAEGKRRNLYESGN